MKSLYCILLLCLASLISADQPCNLPVEVGPCRGDFTRYGYDGATKQCRKFAYGGCGGNANNFHTLEECKKICS